MEKKMKSKLVLFLAGVICISLVCNIILFLKLKQSDTMMILRKATYSTIKNEDSHIFKYEELLKRKFFTFYFNNPQKDDAKMIIHDRFSKDDAVTHYTSEKDIFKGYVLKQDEGVYYFFDSMDKKIGEILLVNSDAFYFISEEEESPVKYFRISDVPMNMKPNLTDLTK